MAKGSDYERELCIEFSVWWSDRRRDDIFWRASGSGARAKVRGRAGRNTAGQHGDICATDPSGAPFIDIFTIEIKRGYSAQNIHDIIDRGPALAVQLWDNFFDQVLESHEQAGSYAWMVINKRDRRRAMVYTPNYAITALRKVGAFAGGKPMPYINLNATVRRGKGGKTINELDLVGMCLEDFLLGVKPEHVKQLAKEA